MTIAGSRRAIASFDEQGEIGLDPYGVRCWTGWRRHITVAMLALACLTAARKDAIRGGVDLKGRDPDLLPLTVPEVRHPLAGLKARPDLDPGQMVRWSEWRRRHRQRARRTHWTRRAWKPPQTRPSYRGLSGRPPTRAAGLGVRQARPGRCPVRDDVTPRGGASQSCHRACRLLPRRPGRAGA